MEAITATKNPPAINLQAIKTLPGKAVFPLMLLGRFLETVFSDDKTAARLERERHSSRNIIYWGMPGA